MNKCIIDNNVLRYMDDLVVEKSVLEACSKIYLSEVVLEEIISRINKTNFNQYKTILFRTKCFNAILREPAVLLAAHWGLRTQIDVFSDSRKYMECVDWILMIQEFSEIEKFVSYVKLMRDLKRRDQNKDLSEIARSAIKRWRSQGWNVSDENLRKESYLSLTTIENQKLFLRSSRRTALAAGIELPSKFGFGEKAFEKAVRHERALELPEISEEKLEEQRKFLEGYLKIYASYISRRTLRISENKYLNDYHDLAVLRYLSFGYSVITSDCQWIEICKEADFLTDLLFITPNGVKVWVIKTD